MQKVTSVVCRAVMTQEDEEGKTGIKIGKELMQVAGRALKMNITRLGPLVLPMSEKLVYAINLLARKVCQSADSTSVALTLLHC